MWTCSGILVFRRSFAFIKNYNHSSIKGIIRLCSIFTKLIKPYDKIDVMRSIVCCSWWQNFLISILRISKYLILCESYRLVTVPLMIFQKFVKLLEVLWLLMEWIQNIQIMRLFKQMGITSIHKKLQNQ
jgi:hypothetical protein